MNRLFSSKKANKTAKKDVQGYACSGCSGQCNGSAVKYGCGCMAW